jgi:hypothetical protein
MPEHRYEEENEELRIPQSQLVPLRWLRPPIAESDHRGHYSVTAAVASAVPWPPSY